MTKLVQAATVFLLKAIARLPFPVIYRIADVLYLLLFYLAGYRKNVVYTNLKNSFPGKGKQELDRIARRFYRHLCDLILESVKFYRMTDKDLDERFVVHGLEKTNAYAAQGKSMILLGTHYNNWEWTASLQRLSGHQALVVYNPLRHNAPMERFLCDSRERFGSKTVPIHLSARTVIRFNQRNQPTCLYLVADQTPSAQSHFWTTFLNQETPFFSGPEHIAIKTGQPVFFQHTRKVARGKYETDLIELFPDPRKVAPDTILLTYVDRMEKVIRENPEYWLWSHRRWKHSRPEGTELTTAVTDHDQG